MNLFWRGCRSILRTVGQLFVCLWAYKLWWMIPTVLLLLLIGLLLAFAQSSAIAPFLYPFF